MKVGTDGVLLGAWIDVSGKEKIVDVGAGTGLIALMLAQRNPMASITAIEIDENACAQAKENIGQSVFKNQIELFHTSFQDFEVINKYDLIVCNPPFFKPTYLSKYDSRNMARQRLNFELMEFFEFAFDSTHEKGELALIYPFEQLNDVVEAAVLQGFFVKHQTLVKGNKNKPFKRVLLQFSKQEENIESSELFIENERHQYTDEFIELVKNFYLNL